MKLFCIILFTLLGTFSLYGQNNYKENFSQDEILLQLHKNESLDEAISGLDNSLKLETKTVSKRFNIHLLHFDETRTTNQFLINSLKETPSVANVQNNHYVSLRKTDETIPNDSLYGYQWALHNVGQNGGIPGSDIDAQKAWDITTGGITASGDTIVVAIIDGGNDLNQEDLSFWKNYGEIPNNDIDDDNNGFVDDFNGWNAYDHNGEIPLSNHGTHVSGIAGAKGNNNVGISGVNWNLKILPIAGESTDEATVVEALSYVYTVREQYDLTDGQEGAFVVANNCSFGVDKGQPEDYPIWEAMYDSLGKLGLLSIGATANRSWDIDDVGDIPTAFTTDYLIAVTNTSQKDELAKNAAYGDTAIDLGAPGQLIMSTLVNNKYGYLSGTSMSTPHVTGAVALMFSAADAEFMADYKIYPDSLALLIKQYILNGTDPIESLVGRTASGGRLNLFNSLNILNDVPSLSVYPSLFTASVLIHESETGTLFVKNTGGSTLNYQVEADDSPEWLSLSSNQGSLQSQETDTILLTFSGESVDTGFYSTSLQVSGENIDTQTIPVEMYVYTDVGIEDDLFSSQSVHVFPNPFRESLSLVVKNVRKKNVSLSIFNVYGKIIYSADALPESDELLLNWSGENSPKGIYFYRLKVEDRELYSGKVIKQ